MHFETSSRDTYAGAMVSYNQFALLQFFLTNGARSSTGRATDS
jgi:hypothetical protein